MLGPVFRVLDPDADAVIALKLFRLDWPPEQAQALAGALHTLIDTLPAHPSIVSPIAAGLEGGTAWLSQELVAADGLDARMRRRTAVGAEALVAVLRQVASALDAGAEAGWRHGALHPRDILVDTTGRVRVTGVGIAQVLERYGARPQRRRPYTAPERGPGQAWDARADVFSLAVVAAEWLAPRRGRPGVEDLPLTLARAGFDGPAAAHVLETATAAAAGDRPVTATSFVDALAATVDPTRSRSRTPAPGSLFSAVDAAPEPIRSPGPPSDVAEESPEDEASPGADTLVTPSPRASRPVAVMPEPVEDPGPPVPSGDAPTLVGDPPGDPGPPPAGDRPAADLPLRHEIEPPPPGRPAVAADEVAGAEDLAGVPDPEWIDREAPDLHGMRATGDREPPPFSEFEPPAGAWTPPPVSREDIVLGAAPVPGAGFADTGKWSPSTRQWSLILSATLLVGVAVGFGLGRWSVARLPAGPAPAPAVASAAPQAAGPTEVRDEPVRAEPPSGPAAAMAVPGSGAPRAPQSPAPDAPRAAAPSRPAAAAPAPPVTGRLVLRSTPPGARVRVGGRDRGVTPVTVAGLEPGRYAVEMSRPGFLDEIRRVEITARQPLVTLDLRLQPQRPTAPAAAPAPAPAAAPAASRAPARLEFVTRPAGAAVWVDGRRVGVSPLTISDVAPGTRAVRFDLPGHATWSSSVTLGPGESRRVSASLEPRR